MNFGCKYTEYENIICRCKFNEKLFLKSSFQIFLNPNIQFIISNEVNKYRNAFYFYSIKQKIDLNLKNKNETDIKNKFPLGIKLIIE